jgi:hypothetical protein
MDIATYTGHLKRLADGLRDLGQPVRDTSQVINMLRGLSPKFRHAVPVITAKKPSHTFLFARSYLLLEEKYDKKHTQTAAQHALVAADCARPPAPAPTSFQGAPHPGQQATGSTSHLNNRGKGKGSNNSGNRPPTPWVPGFNPWTGVVQAWPMPFRVPGSGVLGPRPGAPQQAFYGVPTPALSPPLAPTQGDVWNQQALLAALASASVPPGGPQLAEWYFNTGATSHMAFSSGNLPNARPLSTSSSIIVGNGTTMPVTHTACSSVLGTPFHLHNILVSPSCQEFDFCSRFHP